MDYKPNKNNRLYFYDNTRGFASIAGVFYHVGMIFSQPWALNINPNNFLDSTQFFIEHINLARIPLFLFVSGYFAMYSLQKNKEWLFFDRRMQRIFLPLLLGHIIIGSLQFIFLEHYNGATDITFNDILSYINPLGSNFMLSHFWFLYHLFVFSLVLVGIKNLPSQVKVRVKNLMDKIFTQNFFVFIIIWSASMYFFQVSAKHISNSMSLENELFNLENMALNAVTFFIGCMALMYRKFFEKKIITGQNKKIFISAAIYLISMFLVFFEIPVLNWFFVQIETVSLIVLILNIARRFFNYTNKVLIYISEASYSFYILHHPIVIIVGIFYLTNKVTSGNLIFDYVAMSLVIIFITYALYSLIVKHSKTGDFIITGNTRVNWFTRIRLYFQNESKK